MFKLKSLDGFMGREDPVEFYWNFYLIFIWIGK